MSSTYKKTAKDIAFDRERAKLQSTIFQLRTMNGQLDAENKQLKSEIERLNTIISDCNQTIDNLKKFIEDTHNISDEDLHLIVEKEQNHERAKKTLESFMKMSSSLSSYL